MENYELDLLKMIADIDGTPKGAYNIRANGALASRNITENVLIKEKDGAPGIEIIIKCDNRFCFYWTNMRMPSCSWSNQTTF